MFKSSEHKVHLPLLKTERLDLKLSQNNVYAVYLRIRSNRALIRIYLWSHFYRLQLTQNKTHTTQTHSQTVTHLELTIHHHSSKSARPDEVAQVGPYTLERTIQTKADARVCGPGGPRTLGYLVLRTTHR